MAQKEITLTTALQAAQARTQQQQINTYPSAFSEGLVRQQELPEIDFATEISRALDTLETSVVEYQGREGTVNQPLVDARQKVVLLEAQLEEARKDLSRRRELGSISSTKLFLSRKTGSKVSSIITIA